VSHSGANLSYIEVIAPGDVSVVIYNSAGEQMEKSYVQQPLEDDISGGIGNQKPLTILYFHKPSKDTYKIVFTNPIKNTFNYKFYLYNKDAEVQIKEGNVAAGEEKITVSLFFDPDFSL
jgi:hypothetical protein